MTHKIEVIPYNSSWPQMFEGEAEKIKQALGENCIAIHHIGSTAVPGLCAKPTIGMVPVVLDIMKVDQATQNMQRVGYEPKGLYLQADYKHMAVFPIYPQESSLIKF